MHNNSIAKFKYLVLIIKKMATG